MMLWDPGDTPPFVISLCLKKNNNNNATKISNHPDLPGSAEASPPTFRCQVKWPLFEPLQVHLSMMVIFQCWGFD